MVASTAIAVVASTVAVVASTVASPPGMLQSFCLQFVQFVQLVRLFVQLSG